MPIEYKMPALINSRDKHYLHHMVVTRIKANALTCSRNAVNRSAVDDNTKFSSPSSLLLFNIANASSALLDRW